MAGDPAVTGDAPFDQLGYRRSLPARSLLLGRATSPGGVLTPICAWPEVGLPETLTDVILPDLAVRAAETRALWDLAEDPWGRVPPRPRCSDMPPRVRGARRSTTRWHSVADRLVVRAPRGPTGLATWRRTRPAIPIPRRPVGPRLSRSGVGCATPPAQTTQPGAGLSGRRGAVRRRRSRGNAQRICAHPDRGGHRRRGRPGDPQPRRGPSGPRILPALTT